MVDYFAFQDIPGYARNLSAEHLEILQKDQALTKQLVLFIQEHLAEPKGRKCLEIIQHLNTLNQEESSLIELKILQWKWLAARLYYRLYGCHLEDLFDVDAQETGEKKECNIIDILDILKPKLFPPNSTP